MRFILAIVSFAAAALLIGFGIAQQTVLAGPAEVTAAVETTSDAPVTVIDGKTLNAFPRSQTINISGAKTVFAAYGRTTDVIAWVGDASYNKVSYSAKTGELKSKLIEGTEDEVPPAAGSDLWLADYTEASSLDLTINVPEDISVIIISDGSAPAPGTISITWPIDNSTPWAGPLMIAGGVMLLAGLGFLMWALGHMRRARGPRRNQPKPPKMPKVPTPRYKQARVRSAQANAKGRRSVRSRMVAILPVVLVGSIALGGCSTGAVPTETQGIAANAKLSAESTAAAPTEDEATPEAPAVSVLQASRIVKKIVATATEADAALSSDIIATRFTGPALELRLANYAIRAADPAIAALPPIPSGKIRITLPQQRDSWPRTVLVIIEDAADETVAPVALMLIQDEPRSQYKVHYAIALESGVKTPEVAGATVGTSRYLSDTTFLKLVPDDIALAYADILALDTASASNELFEAEGDSLREKFGVTYRAARKAELPATASLEFSSATGDGEIIALATIDSGAIVAVDLKEIQKATPVEAGAAVNTSGAVKALSGKALSTTGFQATYGYQLLFYVPKIGDTGKIILLGWSQGLVAASEIG